MMVKSATLRLAPPAAFDLFTRRISEWWPAGRRHTGDERSEIVLEQDGRFFERAGDGLEVELGFVRVWRRPERLLFDFFVATGPDRPTEVEVVFAAEGEGTRVTVTHRPKPASEALWTQWAPAYAGSWDLVLAAFADAQGERHCLS